LLTELEGKGGLAAEKKKQTHDKGASDCTFPEKFLCSTFASFFRLFFLLRELTLRESNERPIPPK